VDGIRVVIADPSTVWRKKIKEQLTRTGYLVIATLDNGRTAAQVIFSRQPDIVILDPGLPERDGLEVARVVFEQRVAPVLLVTDDLHWQTFEQAKAAGVYAYLVKPVNDMVLTPAIELAITHFQNELRLENENKKLKETLETRKLVEKAKGLLMSDKHLAEAEAYQYIQRESMNKGKSMRKTAQAIIEFFKENI